MQITSKRYYGTTCTIAQICASAYRISTSVGKPGQREHLSKIFGEPKLDEVPVLRANLSFFNTSDPKSEVMGVARGDSFLNAGIKHGFMYVEPSIPDSPDVEFPASYQLRPVIKGKESFASIAGANPRTMFGQDVNRNFKLILAKGRTLFEKGLTIQEQADVCYQEGLRTAVNLDGGGSSGAYYYDKLLPCSYDGRGLGMILIVYGRYDLNSLPTVRKNSTGVYVHLLQRLLNYFDSVGLVEDGVFGNLTKQAVINYQRCQGLTVDGIVGPKTWRRLTNPWLE